MKKTFIFLTVILGIGLTTGYAAVERQTEKSPLARWGTVMKRGLVNALTLPAEIPMTFKRESGDHSRLWPVTGIPRFVYNLSVRSASAANDITLFPWVSLVTDDVRPWTEPMGLPEYPWQTE
ncbi:MAG: hypothetical protein JW893_07745 [Candidatus Omnitrophica bacterium]|nr:hypothetical protein [Candidatus Omnitrophota bacterium]